MLKNIYIYITHERYSSAAWKRRRAPRIYTARQGYITNHKLLDEYVELIYFSRRGAASKFSRSNTRTRRAAAEHICTLGIGIRTVFFLFEANARSRKGGKNDLPLSPLKSDSFNLAIEGPLYSQRQREPSRHCFIGRDSVFSASQKTIYSFPSLYIFCASSSSSVISTEAPRSRTEAPLCVYCYISLKSVTHFFRARAPSFCK